MNRKETQDILMAFNIFSSVMMDFAAGEDIEEMRPGDTEWTQTEDPEWNPGGNYRICTHLRPYTVTELLEESRKRMTNEVTLIADGGNKTPMRFMLTGPGLENIYVPDLGVSFTLDSMSREFKWPSGDPFGVPK